MEKWRNCCKADRNVEYGLFMISMRCKRLQLYRIRSLQDTISRTRTHQRHNSQASLQHRGSLPHTVRDQRDYRHRLTHTKFEACRNGSTGSCFFRASPSGVNTSGVRRQPINLLRSLYPCSEAIGHVGISRLSANLNLCLRVTNDGPWPCVALRVSAAECTRPQIVIVWLLTAGRARVICFHWRHQRLEGFPASKPPYGWQAILHHTEYIRNGNPWY